MPGMQQQVVGLVQHDPEDVADFAQVTHPRTRQIGAGLNQSTGREVLAPIWHPVDHA
jgi:hypothetical protein